MMEKANVRIGKTSTVLNKCGVTSVTSVQVGEFYGNVIRRVGVRLLDFSEYSCFALYRWPMKDGDAEMIVRQLMAISRFKS